MKSNLMFHITTDDRERSAMAQAATKALSEIAGWEAEPCPSSLPPALMNYLYCSWLCLVVAHWQKRTSMKKLFDAARESRVDIALVEAGMVYPGGASFFVSLIRRFRFEVRHPL